MLGEQNAEEVKYTFVIRYQNAGQNHNIKTSDKSFQNKAKFTCLGTSEINQNCILEKIKSKLNSGNTG